MRTIRQLSAALTALTISVFAVSPASAVNILIVSAETGNDANTCFTFAQACRGLQRAINQASPGDFIQLVTGGTYFSATITNKELTIFSTAGGVISGGESPCLTINNGPTDVVTLDGVTCAAEQDGNHGIVFNTGEKLRFRNGTIRATTTAGCAIFFQPNTNAELYVENSVISENATQGSGGGICIVPRQNAKVTGVIKKVSLQNNRNAVRANAAGSQTVNVLVENSVVSGNFIGLRSDGANSAMRITDNALYGNSTALSAAGGELISLGGNVLRANGTNGAFTSTEVKE